MGIGGGGLGIWASVQGGRCKVGSRRRSGDGRDG